MRKIKSIKNHKPEENNNSRRNARQKSKHRP